MGLCVQSVFKMVGESVMVLIEIGWTFIISLCSECKNDTYNSERHNYHLKLLTQINGVVLDRECIARFTCSHGRVC